jgi:hypothetical protein
MHFTNSAERRGINEPKPFFQAAFFFDFSATGVVVFQSIDGSTTIAPVTPHGAATGIARACQAFCSWQIYGNTIIHWLEIKMATCPGGIVPVPKFFPTVIPIS